MQMLMMKLKDIIPYKNNPRLNDDAVDDIGAGRLASFPQDERFATFEPSFNPPRLKRNELTALPFAV